jgi:hypothetical protein
MKFPRLASSALLAVVAACGDGSGDAVDGTSGPSPGAADISLLFMGNSHTSVNELDDMVTEMVRAGMPGQTIAGVAPIGQAWDLALARHPMLTLHDADGNHSARAGAFLAALMLYATITGRSPGDLPHLSQLGLSPDTQAALRAIAAETVQVVPPRQWCPADPLP